MDVTYFLDGAPQDTICKKKHREFGECWNVWEEVGAFSCWEDFPGKESLSHFLSTSRTTPCHHEWCYSDISQEDVTEEGLWQQKEHLSPL